MLVTAALAHLPSGQVSGVFIEVVDVGTKRLEVRDDKLLPEGLGEQNNVALDTPETEDSRNTQGDYNDSV